MSIAAVDIRDYVPQETGGRGEPSVATGPEPDLAPIGESEWAEAHGISAPPERQEPELAPPDERENGTEGDGSTPPQESDSSEERGLGESEPRDDGPIGQNASSLDRLRDALDEAHGQEAGESDEAWTPFGDAPTTSVRSDDQSKHLKKPPKEIGETVSG